MREWIKDLPGWFTVERINIIHDFDLSELDQGEREAIILAENLRADALIIDERAGRKEALKRGIFVIGTLGILNSAAEKNLIDLPGTISKLRQTSFRASEKLISDLFQLDLDRKNAKNK